MSTLLPGDMRDLLASSRTIAVVGLSTDPQRPSYRVAAYLQAHGYRIIPVNPAAAEILGEPCYATLTDIPVAVDIVDVFRKSEAVLSIAQEAIHIGARCLWLQEGVIHEEAADLARQAGLQLVMDRCLLKEHRAL